MRTRELVVVNFAGGGGSDTGMEAALGFPIDHAINHDAVALGMHRMNHPQTRHHCEDVFHIDPATLAGGRPVGVSWFSPDCKHHSKAKGGQPVEKRIRGLVLVMLRWAKIRTRVMFMENVEEIADWGPLVQMVRNGKQGWYPDPQHKGRTWRAFLDCLGTGIDPAHPDLPEILELLEGTITREQCIRGFGYVFEARELRAFRYDTPTIRKRLYMIARCDGRPIVWPDPTHDEPKAGSTLKPWRTIAECIDWQLPCPSIFLKGQAAKKARCKRPLAPATLRRIARGIERYMLTAERPFIVSLTHQGGDRVENIDQPAATITGAHRGEKAFVSAMLTEHAQANNQRNMPVDEPMRTQCAAVKGGHFAMVAGTLVHVAHGEEDKNGNKRRGRGARDLSEPMPTVTASPDCAFVAGTLVQTGYGERPGQSPRVNDVQEPLGTVVSGGGKHALAAASLVKMRGTNIGSGADEPMHTASAGGTHHGLVMACMAQHNGGFNATIARPVDEPVSTLSTRGSQQQLVTASIAAYYGSEKDGQGIEEPARTTTTKARLGLVECRSSFPGLTPAQLAGARRVAKFLRSQGVQFEGELVTLRGHVMIDIGMRMLTPRELFRAMGFPESYIIDRARMVNSETGEEYERPLTKEEQIRMCGNAVCPPVARALLEANVPDLIQRPPRPIWPEMERRAA